MAESRVGFLNKIVSNLPQSENNESLKLLRSYYLMRCKEITLGYGLPIAHFSPKSRCPRCCLEWTKKADVKIKPINLSNRQKQRIRLKKIKISNENKVNARKALLQSNQMEQTCSFCKQTTITTLPKPVKEYPRKDKTSGPITKTATKAAQKQKNSAKEVTKINKSKTDNKKTMESKKNASNTNMYSNAFDVFSLKNNQNTLASTIKEPPKVIKNNKKKKDKFAGLCQKAVLASSKPKPEQIQDKMQNKLSLFLKPSSG